MKNNFHIPFSEYLKPCIKYKKIRSEKRANYIKSHYSLTQSKILEAGCGPGFLIQRLSKILPDNIYFAMDIQRPALKYIMDQNTDTSILHCVQNESYRFPFKGNIFDLVICEECLHGLEFLPFFSEIVRILKPGGKAFFIDINPKSFFFKFIKFKKLFLNWFNKSSLTLFDKAFIYSIDFGYKKNNLLEIIVRFDNINYRFNTSLNWYYFEVRKIS